MEYNDQLTDFDLDLMRIQAIDRKKKRDFSNSNVHLKEPPKKEVKAGITFDSHGKRLVQ